jgi:hypothetical protein
MPAPPDLLRPIESKVAARPPWRSACLAGALALLVALVAMTLFLGALGSHPLTFVFYRDQDAPFIAAMAILLLVLGLARLPACIQRQAETVLDRLSAQPGLAAAILALLVVGIAATGAFVILGGFPLTRDELMADFDAAIFASRRLIVALPPDWAAFRDALAPEFVLPVRAPVWVSSYLPGNAALRAVVGAVVDPRWTSPLFAGIAVVALWRVARRLWPDRPDAVVVSLVMLATSSQVLVMATTSYAMTAHLAVNLSWLALHLRDDRPGHAGAIVLGALATGLHQLVFHPLFVAPFVLHLWGRRRHRLAILYAAAYAVIGVFWTSYPGLVLAGIDQGAGADAANLGIAGLVTQITELLRRFESDGIALMSANLLRFAAWQHLLLLPLVGAAFGAVRRSEGIVRPLAGGILLTLAATFVLMPYQGHGWGYRYLHGLLGNAALLAGSGWLALTASAARDRAGAATAFAFTTALAALVALPIHVVQVARMTAPSRAATATIAHADVDVVLIDRTGIAFAIDLVRNDPLLRNRPKVVDLDGVDGSKLELLCSRGSVAVFDRRQAEALGMMAQPVAEPEDVMRAERRAVLARLGCGTPVVIRPRHSTIPLRSS